MAVRLSPNLAVILLPPKLAHNTAMLGCLMMLNGLAGIVAMWLLWGKGHDTLWWSLLGVLVFSYIVNETVRTAYKDARSRNPDASDPVGGQLAHWDATRDPVVRF